MPIAFVAAASGRRYSVFSGVFTQTLKPLCINLGGIMAGDHMVEFTDQNFEEQVLKSAKPVLVDFWAPWCAPCRMMASTVEAVAGEYADRALVGKLNVDDNQSVAGKYNIRGIPTLLLFKDGQVAEQVVGATSKDVVTKMIEKHL
ncbi:MAG: thioredoxin [Terriglobia bacterium]